MTDARRLSARLREMIRTSSDLVDYEVALLSDAARLAELVEAWKEAREEGRSTLSEAESALLAFDLIGRGGVQ